MNDIVWNNTFKKLLQRAEKQSPNYKQTDGSLLWTQYSLDVHNSLDVHKFTSYTQSTRYTQFNYLQLVNFISLRKMKIASPQVFINKEQVESNVPLLALNKREKKRYHKYMNKRWDNRNAFDYITETATGASLKKVAFWVPRQRLMVWSPRKAENAASWYSHSLICFSYSVAGVPVYPDFPTFVPTSELSSTCLCSSEAAQSV